MLATFSKLELAALRSWITRLCMSRQLGAVQISQSDVFASRPAAEVTIDSNHGRMFFSLGSIRGSIHGLNSRGVLSATFLASLCRGCAWLERGSVHTFRV